MQEKNQDIDIYIGNGARYSVYGINIVTDLISTINLKEARKPKTQNKRDVIAFLRPNLFVKSKI